MKAKRPEFGFFGLLGFKIRKEFSLASLYPNNIAAVLAILYSLELLFISRKLGELEQILAFNSWKQLSFILLQYLWEISRLYYQVLMGLLGNKNGNRKVPLHYGLKVRSQLQKIEPVDRGLEFLWRTYEKKRRSGEIWTYSHEANLSGLHLPELDKKLVESSLEIGKSFNAIPQKSYHQVI